MDRNEIEKQYKKAMSRVRRRYNTAVKHDIDTSIFDRNEIQLRKLFGVNMFDTDLFKYSDEQLQGATLRYNSILNSQTSTVTGYNEAVKKRLKSLGLSDYGRSSKQLAEIGKAMNALTSKVMEYGYTSDMIMKAFKSAGVKQIDGRIDVGGNGVVASDLIDRLETYMKIEGDNVVKEGFDDLIRDGYIKETVGVNELDPELRLEYDLTGKDGKEVDVIIKYNDGKVTRRLDV